MELNGDVNNNRDRAIYSDAIEIPDVHEQQEEPLLSQQQDPILVDLYSATTPSSRITRLKQKLTKRNIKKLIYKWRWPLFIFMSSIVFGLIMWAYKKELFEGLETLSYKLKDMGYRFVKHMLNYGQFD